MKNSCRGRRVLRAISLASVFACSLTLADPPPQARTGQNFPVVSLPARANGAAAIAALSDKLPAVAAAYGLTPAEFTRLLREDPTAWIDRAGRLLYIDEMPEPADPQTTDTLQPAPYPLAETFQLHSRPGSSKTIYLDFDGHITSGTAWNSGTLDPIVSPAYTRDGDPAFSNSELANIQNMWRQVAEDYAPFDVNVTTQDPGEAALTRSSTGDLQYGVRVVITTDNFDNCGCGGFAYVSAYDNTGDYLKPAFVFNTGVVGAGEAISHEAGHTLGLSHDGASGGVSYYPGHGSGDTGWAPIMGVGYYQLLVQWSKGEYAGATNTEDDLAIIQNHGLAPVPDDHGNNLTSATALDAVGNGTTATISGSGLISQRNDVDVFSFVSGAGSYTIDVDTVYYSPNIDLKADLLDAGGAVIATSNPGATLPASLAGTLAAGEYFLRIDGVGKGDPAGTGYSDYASLGRYAISGTVADAGTLAPPVANAQVSYTPGPAPLAVSFDGSTSTDSDGHVQNWNWAFGDGAVGTGATASHTYTAPGSYQVVLTVIDNNGLSASDAATVQVANRPPVATASADVLSGEAPLRVAFDGTDSFDPDLQGTLVAYDWSFGDGSTGSGATVEHVYNNAGSFTATLTVTDDQGDSSTSSGLVVNVTPPPFVLKSASSEEPGAGTVAGSLAATTGDDGQVETITEIESGGKPNRRYSYLSHTWVFNNVQAGNAVTLLLSAWHERTADDEAMSFSYSVNSGPYQSLPINLMSSEAPFSVALPSGGGQIRIRVEDTDRTSGKRSLDTVYIDQMLIRTDNNGGLVQPDPPLGASGTAAMALSPSEIRVSWTDNSDDEVGFRVERSADSGAKWVEAASAGADQSSVDDMGLTAATSYLYRVVAFNGAGDGEFSDAASATTEPLPDITLQASGYKQRGVMTVDLTWQGLSSGILYRNGSRVGQFSDGFTDSLGKGSGTFTYQLCVAELGGECSNTATVVF